MIYHIPNGNDALRIKFNRELFSYKTQSHLGKYVRFTKGILTNYNKPIRSCVIFNQKKIQEVQKLCKKMKINASFFKIEKIKN